MPKQNDAAVLEMALVGYQAELRKIEASMSAIRKQLGVRGSGVRATASAVGPKPKRVLSPAARKRIADAQKKRWKAFRAKQQPV